MIQLFNQFFYEPIFNLVIWLYNVIPGENLGLSIIALTIIIKLILLPLSQKSIKSQKALQEIQPKIDELKNKYKGDKEKMGKEMMNLYKEHKVNPFSSCLPLLIQLPFLLAVFRVFRNGIENNLSLVYPFIETPESIHSMWLGINLAERSIFLAILAGVAQFWQAKMMMAKKPEVKTKGSKDENMAAIMSKQMVYFMPVITIFIGLSLPGGLTLYWFLITLFTALQQVFVFKQKKRNKEKKLVIEGEVKENENKKIEK
jgi:YidC/Oxa1 family membrane protein insertase